MSQLAELLLEALRGCRSVADRVPQPGMEPILRC